MPKVYPLEIEELQDPDSGDALGYFSKGHWTDAEFKAALAAYLGHELRPRVQPARDWWRVALYGRDQMYDIAKPGQRGAFPVTVVDTW